MAEKKKAAGQSTARNRTTESAKTKAQGSEKAIPAKSISATARDERKEQPVKSSSAAARVERKEPAKQEVKPVRREKKGPSWEARIRANRYGRFIIEAYYELRHKVTWPTFDEARNMTVVVILLSAVIGGILALADFGLTQLFFLIK